MSGDALPLAPLTDEGVRAELEDAWDDLAAWAKALARLPSGNGMTGHIHAQITRAADRHDVALNATYARTRR